MDHPSGRQGPEERWYELRPYGAFHYPLVGHRIHGDLPHLQACQEARRPRLRGHTLIPRGLVNIKKNIPVTIIMNI